MIEINLIPGQKKKGKKAGGARFKLALPDFRALLATIKDPYLIAAVAATVLAVGGGGALFVLDQATLAALDHRLETVKAEKRRFDIMIAEKRKMEMSRDSLLAEITVIRRIDEDRYVWPHLLDQPASRRRLRRPVCRPRATRSGWARCASRSTAVPWTSRRSRASCGS